jgi:peptidylprolyl isomerase
MEINKTAVVITLVVLAVIFAGFYFGGYFKPNSAITEQPTTNNTNNSMNQTQNTASPKVDIVTLKEGSGPAAKNGDKLTVNYIGTLTDGTKFDSSLDPGREPFTFTLGAGQVIKGWDEGLAGMKVGEERKLTVPPELGYGAQSPSSKIPANSTLIFDVTLLKIN